MVCIASITNKIYDIKVSETKDSYDGKVTGSGVDVESPPPEYEEKKHPSAQIFIKSFDGKSVRE